MKLKLILIPLVVLLLLSCEAPERNNPFDSACPKEIWTPTNFQATQVGNTIKLTWNIPSANFEGFRIAKRVNNGSTISLGDYPKNTNQLIDNNIVGGQQHIYTIYAYAGNNQSNTINTQITPIALPTITTAIPSAIHFNYSILGGNISNNGGSTIISRGVVWSTSTNPTIALATKTIDGVGSGSFVSNLSPLNLHVTYYARAYATNSMGTSYGNEVSFTTSYAIGDRGPANGFIFYDKGFSSNGWRYLEASPSDYYTGIAWWNGTWVYTNTTGISPNTSLGAGKANTLLIISANNNLSNAAKVCDSYSYNGFSDWYLPSSEELQLICQNLYSAGIGNLQPNFYWSSTDTNRIHNATWMQLNGCYVRTDIGRDMLNLVRPIRQF